MAIAVKTGKKRKQRNYRRRRAPHYVPGVGGMIGRGAKFLRGYTSKGGLAYKALTLARKVADAVNIEYKISDTNSGPQGVDYSGGVLTMLSGISQGVADNQRIGDSIKVQNNMLRFSIARNGADSMVRVLLIWDKQNQIAATSDVLEVVGSVNAPLSPKHYDKRFRCKVLFDKTYTVDTNRSILTDECLLDINQHVQFSAGSTTEYTGDLILMTISNQATTNLPTFQYYNRVSYTDN